MKNTILTSFLVLALFTVQQSNAQTRSGSVGNDPGPTPVLGTELETVFVYVFATCYCDPNTKGGPNIRHLFYSQIMELKTSEFCTTEGIRQISNVVGNRSGNYNCTEPLKSIYRKLLDSSVNNPSAIFDTDIGVIVYDTFQQTEGDFIARMRTWEKYEWVKHKLDVSN